jgi:predicted porin
MYEERDGDDCGSIVGLKGDHDLMAAVGMFGQVEFEVRFRREEWLYRA